MSFRGIFKYFWSRPVTVRTSLKNVDVVTVKALLFMKITDSSIRLQNVRGILSIDKNMLGAGHSTSPHMAGSTSAERACSV